MSPPRGPGDRGPKETAVGCYLNSDHAGLTRKRRSRQASRPPKHRCNRGRTTVMNVVSPLCAWQAPPGLGVGKHSAGPMHVAR